MPGVILNFRIAFLSDEIIDWYTSVMGMDTYCNRLIFQMLIGFFSSKSFMSLCHNIIRFTRQNFEYLFSNFHSTGVFCILPPSISGIRHYVNCANFIFIWGNLFKNRNINGVLLFFLYMFLSFWNNSCLLCLEIFPMPSPSRNRT